MQVFCWTPFPFKFKGSNSVGSPFPFKIKGSNSVGSPFPFKLKGPNSVGHLFLSKSMKKLRILLDTFSFQNKVGILLDTFSFQNKWLLGPPQGIPGEALGEAQGAIYFERKRCPTKSLLYFERKRCPTESLVFSLILKGKGVQQNWGPLI